MNVLNAIGNLPRDSEVRFLPDGTAVLGFSFALNAGFGEKQSTSWLNCSLFGKRAERLAPMLLKGTKIGVTGEFSISKYPDKAGVIQTSPELRVNDVTLLGKKDAAAPAASTAPAPTAEEELSEDIPF
tara:strand:- start:4406 stop:4789 length:384 start_codon:yes stop_codon:yes gene_type:complete